MTQGKSKKVSTKTRILETALTLFNEQRYTEVTTAALAKEVGIAEGNLWYHFKNKSALLDGLAERFLDEVQLRLQLRPSGGPILPEYLEFFGIMSREIATYRFLFRDQDDYGERVGHLMARIPGLYRQTAEQYRAYFNMMRQQGYLQLTDAELERVLVGLIMLFRYYLDFAREAGLPENEGASAARRAFSLHLQLYEDRLTDEARQFFQAQLKLDELSTAIL